ncbi:hypothetical protein AX16_007838 [Volvariella volvacea WC 439]|nr:hypothetical protein AX16_007838 [Volvariella volvacea WC 439]
MTLAVKAGGLTSPGSEASHLSALTLVSQTDDTVSAPYAVSTQERAWYYYGVTADGDQPELLYRTSSKEDPWVPPVGRHANMPTKSARPAHDTQLSKVWGTVGPKVEDLVHAAVKGSYSIDPARFFTVPPGEDVKNGTLGPAIVWVTVHPDSNISVDTVHDVSQSILELLAENGVNDAHVEWCEGVTFKAASLPLLPVVNRYDATAYVRRHLTPALGIPIAPAEMEEQDGQGSVGFFFHENIDKHGNPSDKVLAVTNHHVVCKMDDKLYDWRARGSPRQQVRVCGFRRFQRGLDEIRADVVNHGHDAGVCAEEIAELEADGDEADPETLDKARRKLEEHRAAIVKLKSLYKDVNASWGDIARRNIGVLEYSPPIFVDVDDRQYTEDWATIRLDEARFKPNFVGNQVDLGTAFTPSQLKTLLHPWNDGTTPFKYPSNRLLKIRGFVPKEKLANPDSFDSEGQPCIIVMKHGCTTDLTVGRCAGLESFVCDETGVRSVEVAVYNYDKQSRPFSAKGDSGSLIFDRNGQMVALLHSGKAKTGSSATHVTYGTPAWRLREWIKAVYPNADFARETW